MYREESKQKARELRAKGLTYSEIEEQLSIPKRTIRSWASDIQLSSVQQEKIKDKIYSNLTYTGSSKGRKTKKRIEMGEEAWRLYQEEKQKLKQQRNYQNYKIQIRIAGVNYKNNLKKKFIEYKGGKCEICGYNKDCPTAYHFHHTDPNEKEFGISQTKRKYKSVDAYKELDKCQLLCSNCHSEIHDALYEKQREETVKRLTDLLDSDERCSSA